MHKVLQEKIAADERAAALENATLMDQEAEMIDNDEDEDEEELENDPAMVDEEE